jgi:predicted secreted Zn-dependent protease
MTGSQDSDKYIPPGTIKLGASLNVRNFLFGFGIACIIATQFAFGQGYATKGRDGAIEYSNRPPEAAQADGPVQVNPAGAEVAVYMLNGATLEEVQTEAAQKAPIDPASGKRVWSATTWNAAWNYWTRQEGDACRIGVVSVRLKIATQLPAWTSPKDAPPADTCRWEQFVKILRQKEASQSARALARARELERTILALPPHPRCEPFAAEVAALGQQLVDDGMPRPATAPAVVPTMVAKPMAKSPAKPAPPAPPKPLPISLPRAALDACRS